MIAEIPGNILKGVVSKGAIRIGSRFIGRRIAGVAADAFGVYCAWKAYSTYMKKDPEYRALMEITDETMRWRTVAELIGRKHYPFGQFVDIPGPESAIFDLGAKEEVYISTSRFSGPDGKPNKLYCIKKDQLKDITNESVVIMPNTGEARGKIKQALEILTESRDLGAEEYRSRHDQTIAGPGVTSIIIPMMGSL